MTPCGIAPGFPTPSRALARMGTHSLRRALESLRTALRYILGRARSERVFRNSYRLLRGRHVWGHDGRYLAPRVLPLPWLRSPPKEDQSPARRHTERPPSPLAPSSPASEHAPGRAASTKVRIGDAAQFSTQSGRSELLAYEGNATRLIILISPDDRRIPGYGGHLNVQRCPSLSRSTPCPKNAIP